MFIYLSDSTAGWTEQNSLETQVVNQCSRAMVRSVIKKVALPPLTQNNAGGQQTSVVGPQTSDANKKGLHTVIHGDTQSAFIDQSAHEFLNTTSKTRLNIDPNMGGLRCVLNSLLLDIRLTIAS